ncbi:MAG: response regulator [Candidatus Sumerlaeia bacterium]|nr:response regulator [Candidatus Sumerlaeia bacterium]
MATILLVEDVEINRELLERRLTKKGYRILCAMNGQEAVEMAFQHKPDLILMDMSLPIMDGWEATRAIKSNPETHGIPIIGLSAHAMDEERLQSLEAGCCDYDTKPVDINRLLGKISQILGE